PAPTACRSGVCDPGGTCRAACSGDGDCVTGDYCDAATHACKPAAANGAKPDGGQCTRAGEGRSGVCGATGVCGGAFGDACGADVLCQAGVCDPHDLECGIANGNGPCAADTATRCRAGICDQGMCGHPVGAPCADSTQCATSFCSVNGQVCA